MYLWQNGSDEDVWCVNFPSKCHSKVYFCGVNFEVNAVMILLALPVTDEFIT